MVWQVVCALGSAVCGAPTMLMMLSLCMYVCVLFGRWHGSAGWSVYMCVCVCVCGLAGGMAHLGGQQAHVWGAGGQRLVGDILPNVVLPHQNQDPRQLAGNSHNCHITISSSH